MKHFFFQDSFFKSIVFFLALKFWKLFVGLLLYQVLQFIYASRCGMLESELLALLPDLSWSELCAHYEFLSTHLIVKYQLGLLTFNHTQVRLLLYFLSFDFLKKENLKIRVGI